MLCLGCALIVDQCQVCLKSMQAPRSQKKLNELILARDKMEEVVKRAELEYQVWLKDHPQAKVLLAIDAAVRATAQTYLKPYQDAIEACETSLRMMPPLLLSWTDFDPYVLSRRNLSEATIAAKVEEARVFLIQNPLVQAAREAVGLAISEGERSASHACEAAVRQAHYSYLHLALQLLQRLDEEPAGSTGTTDVAPSQPVDADANSLGLAAIAAHMAKFPPLPPVLETLELEGEVYTLPHYQH